MPPGTFSGEQTTDRISKRSKSYRISLALPKIKARKEEIVVSGPKERLALYLKRLAPGILNRILKRSKVV